MKKLFTLALTTITLLASYTTFAQEVDPAEIPQNALTTAVPFMGIAPDSRAGAMGDAGVATSPDAYSQYWNSSKYAFTKDRMGFAISYTPWLKKLVDDMSLTYLSAFYKLDKDQTFGASMRYFSMGAINFTDEQGNEWSTFNPNEFSFDASYNRKLGKNFALGVVGRFIYSNLTGGLTNGAGEASSVGTSGAVDINGYYNNDIEVSGYDASWAMGFNISNLGSKLSYTEDEKNFIPTNLRLGGSFTIDIDDYNSLTAAVDFNKLLVPSPPVRQGDTLIVAGKDNEVGVITGVFQSFSDAPGVAGLTPFQEELSEINVSVGAEYWYAEQFAVRAGYFHESKYKGARKYATAGIGLRMNVFGLDFSYLIPTGGSFNNSPLAGTWRFSLIFNMANL